MFAASAVGNTTKPRVIPKAASLPAPNGKTFRKISTAPCAALTRTCSTKHNNEIITGWVTGRCIKPQQLAMANI